MLDQKIKDRIAKQAQDWRKNRPIYTPAYVATGYIAGGEAEAERAQGLVEALEYLMNDVRNKPNDTRYATALKKGAEALTKYNNSK